MKTQEKTEAQKKHFERRAELRQYSAIAKELQKQYPEMKINEILISLIYTDENNTIFKTLHDWNAEGFSIIPGSKSFLIWGKPKERKVTEPAQQKDAQSEEEKDDWFPLCYLFSNAQVKPTESKK